MRDFNRGLYVDLGGIGHLFKHMAVSTQSQEFLLFLTPRGKAHGQDGADRGYHGGAAI